MGESHWPVTGELNPWPLETPHEHDAYSSSEWLRDVDSDGSLARYLCQQ